jgi:hypothetical protein
MLGDFNAKMRSKDIFKLTTGKTSLQEINNEHGFRVLNFGTSKKSAACELSHVLTPSINSSLLLQRLRS